MCPESMDSEYTSKRDPSTTEMSQKYSLIRTKRSEVKAAKTNIIIDFLLNFK